MTKEEYMQRTQELRAKREANTVAWVSYQQDLLQAYYDEKNGIEEDYRRRKQQATMRYYQNMSTAKAAYNKRDRELYDQVVILQTEYQQSKEGGER
ncbi:hypothetical protein PRBRB14_02220 [Hallella multisaccharivorax DSM 17128]|uniref:Uncharacterized protein n=1 Tax=Hallella multisaccharivorax DSM 17128 TaxID=688246 RepID=F8NAP6_9BACT|nr:hypothetical protein [Hallella multisaccharivorax]EGN55846.1 hypothetical protein Premu_0364 [Hallella multisaccharivorax DSM 17128]GJG29343.1 hypothetical protein PRBRB14_02220 [Hallella multisaccharivorax DSM 17128]